MSGRVSGCERERRQRVSECERERRQRESVCLCERVSVCVFLKNKYLKMFQKKQSLYLSQCTCMCAVG